MEMKAEYLEIFSQEAGDQLKDWEENLLGLERDPEEKEKLDGLFRAVHTLKGSAGFIGFDALQKLAHDLESSLAAVREGTRPFDGVLSDVMFTGLDMCSSMIECFTRGETFEGDADGLRRRIAELDAKPTAPPLPARSRGGPAVPAAGGAPAALAQTCRLSIRIEGQPREAYLRSFLVKARVERLGRIVNTDPSPVTLRDSAGAFAYEMTVESSTDPEALARQISIDQVTVGPITAAPAPAGRESGVPRPEGMERSEEVVRVSVQKLDALLNLVGELVIHNSGFIATADALRHEYGRSRLSSELEEKTEALSAITRQLQDGIMKARMLPVASVFNRFHRVVRDLSKISGKDVTLTITGEETEIDKKVIDRIGEPLVHLVRNAVDHGLEPSAERTARGKSPEGTVGLAAFQEGDHICIQVSDDGRGLDREAIVRKAVQKGLISPKEADGADDERILGFIFLPGFSTASTVTDVSGRGVGMDAVKRSVDDMNGTVRVRSAVGKGTVVTITLPLTMAIITAALVEAAGSTYAIPLSAVREIVKESGPRVKSVGTRPVILVREEVLPLADLSSVISGTASSRAQPSRGPAADAGRPVVIVDFEGRKIGLAADRILGTREIVVKSLNRHYREVEGLIGASILGNGKIALIVDTEALVSSNHRSGTGTSGGHGVTLERDMILRGLAAGAPVTADSAPERSGTEEPAAERLAALMAGPAGRKLEDIHNTGALQASLSLSQLTGQEIRVSFPESRLVPLKDVAGLMGGEEASVGGIYVGVHGDITGGVLLVLPEKNLLVMDDMLQGRSPGAGRSEDPGRLLSDIDLSGLSEVGNILACSFLNAFAEAGGITAHAEVPEISIDMCLPVIDSVLARFNQPGENILFTEAAIFGPDTETVVCHQLLFLEPGSLQRVMGAPAGSAGASAEAEAVAVRA